MSDTLYSRPYKPQEACERCCFGRGTHAEWCKLTDVFFFSPPAQQFVSVEDMASWYKENPGHLAVARNVLKSESRDATERTRGTHG